MPPKSQKRKRLQLNLQKARESKRAHFTEVDSPEAHSSHSDGRHEERNEPEDISDLLNLSHDAIDTENEEIDPSFDLDSSIKSDSEHAVEAFCEEWVTSLSWEDRASLGLFLTFQLKSAVQKGDTEAAEMAGMMIGKSDKTIREWRKNFMETNEVPHSAQGQYQRTGVLWKCEHLNSVATQYIRSNASVKGKSNLTVASFCEWVNESLLPNETLEPGFPRKISIETARQWMHKMGFQVLTAKKGSFVDGHEREDVVDYRKKFLRRMIALGFLNRNNAPTDEARNALPADLECPPEEILNKTVVIFHDESTFQCNDDQPTFWGTKGTVAIKPKHKGAGIMVSDFIDEKNGYLALTQEEYDVAKQTDPNIWMQARAFLEYGESKEGYWTSEKFMEQIVMAVKIAEYKYPQDDGWKIVWIFDHSSCHSAMADDSLDVNKMNVNPGGKQRVMRDGWWGGKPQKMNYAIGIPKGLRVVLEERDVDTRGMNADQMRAILGSHPDFKGEKSTVERFLTEEKKHIAYFLPKYHPELNPIERVWAQSKRYTKAYCKYNLPSLRKNVTPALESVSLESIQKHFRKVRHYMFAYLEGLPGGSELEKLVKQYKKSVQSHRRISDKQ